MVNRSKFSYSYRKVVTQLQNSNLKGIKKGLLYNAIMVLFGEETSQGQQETVKTKEISNLFNIQPSNSLEDDIKLCHQILDSLNFEDFANVNEGKSNMEWLVLITASILVGSPVCYYYLKRAKQQAQNPRKAHEVDLIIQEKDQPSAPPPIPAVLCLVIPASIAANLNVEQKLDSTEIKKLVDSAFYFICTQKSQADIQESNLSLSEANQPIPTESQKETYIRIKINDGRAVIDKRTRYGLKDDLPESASGVIQKIDCLKDLSGLETFVRI